MNNTPKSNRKHIAFYGKRNAGKSSIMNEIMGQEISLVSDVKGTTTDPVSKAMELIPFGPVVFIDTGGIDDRGKLGKLRVKKTLMTLDKVDCAIYVINGEDMEDVEYLEFIKEFNQRKIPYITVINKMDLLSEEEKNILDKKIEEEGWKNSIGISTKNKKDISSLRNKIVEILGSLDEEESLIGDIVPYGGKIIMVIPIDFEAPKGRLILPQVQLIRDSLEHGIKSYIVRDSELESAIKDLENIDLVVTDSKIFKEVNDLIPKNLELTSFSILMSRQKGDLQVFLNGIRSLESLKSQDNPRILIMESCSHNTSHEDIGRVKIPNLLGKYFGREIGFDFAMGQNFPEDLGRYDLVIHCGSCMLNKKTMLNRISLCRERNIPITNYGILLAYLGGILDRAVNIFTDKD